MTTLRVFLCVSFAFACMTMGQDAVTPVDVIQQVAECVRKSKALEKRLTDATGGMQLEQQAAQQAAREYGKPYDAKRVEELRSHVKQQKQFLARSEAELAAATVELPEERAAKKAEAELQAKEAQKAYREASAPFREERTAIHRETRAIDTALKALLKGAALAPKELGVAEAKVSTSASSGFIAFNWHDAKGKQLAWAHMNLRPVPKKIHEQGKVAGKYPVHSLSNNSAWFWAGGLHIAFIVQEAEWQGKDKVLAMAAKLLDVDALAALPKIEDVK